VAVERFGGGGRGIVATRDIACGDVLVSVPVDSIFCHLHLNDQIAEANRMGPDDALVAALLIERSKRQRSKWFEYIAVLPESEPIAATWTESAILYLGDERIRNAAKEDKAHRTSLVTKLQDIISSSVPSVEVTETSVEWACSIIASRSCFLNEQGWRDLRATMKSSQSNDSLSAGIRSAQGRPHKTLGVLVPYLDMFNHSTDPVAVDRYCERARTLQLVSTRTYRAGEEVQIHYGALCNYELIRWWGFALEKNTHEYIPVHPSEVIPAEFMNISKADAVAAADVLYIAHDLTNSDPSYIREVSNECSLDWHLLVRMQLAAIHVRTCPCKLPSDLASFLGGNEFLCQCVRDLCQGWLRKFATRKLLKLGQLSPPPLSPAPGTSFREAASNARVLPIAQAFRAGRTVILESLLGSTSPH